METLRKLLKITDFPVESSKKLMKHREKHVFFEEKRGFPSSNPEKSAEYH